MSSYYTDERNAQIVISLLKQHQIRKIVASPGSTNVCLVASLQCDPYFEMFSAPDERSAAYMACGMAAESGEPVVLSCTGATASRNYFPGLTEAYYRKLPVLAITSSRRSTRIGHNFDQVTDRTAMLKDVVKVSVQVPVVLDLETEWGCVIAANKAMLELRHRGGGPAHINLETTYSPNCNVKELPTAKAIFRYTNKDKLPELKAGKVAVFVGAHLPWSQILTDAVDEFCWKYNAVVLCDHTSNYYGNYRVLPNLAAHQKNYNSVVRQTEVLIHIGDISTSEYGIKQCRTWRVNPDGEIRDTFFSLENIFEFDELDFFETYSRMKKDGNNTFYKECLNEEQEMLNAIPEIPFSNVWVAHEMAALIPKNSELHLGIRNSLRSWNFFDIPHSVLGFSNTGGFGIDGSLSTVLGASQVCKDKLYYCILGDLAFFYDMNALGNRHVGDNLRILLINNGTGMEMRFSSFLPSRIGADTEPYISATGHYGNKSESLVRHFAEDLGFEYMSATNKSEFLRQLNTFVSEKKRSRSIIFELFVDPSADDTAYNLLAEIRQTPAQAAKNAIYDALGKKNIEAVKRLIKR